MKNSFRRGVAGLLAGVGAALSGTAFAAADPANFVLPTGFVEYGDAQSYSLGVACAVVGASGPGCPFYVTSTPGAIKDLIVVATGASGGGVTTNVAGIDDAYGTPSGVSGSTFFTTRDSGAGVNVTGVENNLTTTWDASVGALNTFLGASSQGLVFFFNNNQTNSGAATNQRLAAWAQIWLTNPGGALVTDSVFYFTNQFANGNAGSLAGNGIYSPEPSNGCFSTGGNPNINAGLGGPCDPSVMNFKGPQGAASLSILPGVASATQTDYVLSGGQICLNSANTAVPCSSPTAVTAVNNNLGANQAAYALVFPELNAMLAGLKNAAGEDRYTLHLDVQLGCDPIFTTTAACIGKSLNNGFEQIFIGALAAPGTPPPPIPEPASLALVGLALAGLALVSSRRRKAAV